MDRLANSLVNIQNPVFLSIQSAVFSGSTLIASLLGCHPQISTVGELDGIIPRTNPNDYFCSCGRRLRTCAFWHAIALSMAKKGFEFDVRNFNTKFRLDSASCIRYVLYAPLLGSRMAKLAPYLWAAIFSQHKICLARNVAIIKTILELTGKNVFVDSSKNRLRLAFVQWFSPLDVRAVHLIRDVRGMVASRVKRNHNGTVQAFAKEWVRTNKRIRLALLSFPRKYRMIIRYEDLCNNANETLRKIHILSGIEAKDTIRNLAYVTQHIVGNEMRLKPLRRIELDDTWKTLLSAKDLEEINRVAGPLGRKYGYDI